MLPLYIAIASLISSFLLQTYKQFVGAMAVPSAIAEAATTNAANTVPTIATEAVDGDAGVNHYVVPMGNPILKPVRTCMES